MEEGERHQNVKHWASKDAVKKLKSQLTEWKTIFADHLSNRAQYVGLRKNDYNVTKDKIPTKKQAK